MLRPGGWAYMSWTNWYSPWGGHDMSPVAPPRPPLGPAGCTSAAMGHPARTATARGCSPCTSDRRCGSSGASTASPSTAPSLGTGPGPAWCCACPACASSSPGTACCTSGRQGEGSRGRAGEGAGPSSTGVAGWLSDDQARRLWDRARGAGAGGHGRGDRELPGSVDSGARHRGAVGHHRRGHRSACRQRPRAPAVGGNRRRRRGRPPGLPGQPAAGSACSIASATSAGSATTPSMRSTARSSCSTSTAPTAIGPARDDLVRWGDRVAPGGTMLIHDAYSSVGVTLAMLVTTVLRHAGSATSGGAARWSSSGASRCAGVARGGQRGPPTGAVAVVRPEPGDQGADRGAAPPAHPVAGPHRRRLALLSGRVAPPPAGGHPDLPGGPEHRRPCCGALWRPCPTARCSSSTTAAPTAPPTSPRRWAPSWVGSRCSVERRRPVSGVPIATGSRGESSAATTC